MKTILHTIDVTGSGGAETVFLSLIKNLDKQQYQSIVVIAGTGWLYDQLDAMGVEPIVIDMSGSLNFGLVKNLIRIIKDHNVDIVQSHLFGSNLYSSIAGLFTRASVVSTFHGAIDIEGGKFYRWLKTWLINLGSKKVISVSNYLRQKLIAETCITEKKSAVIYNGVNMIEFQAEKIERRIKTERGWGENVYLVGLIGNLNAAKAYEVLIEAAAILKTGRPEIRYVIAGDTRNLVYPALDNLLGRHQLRDTVEFLGFVDNMAEFLAEIDLYVICSESEGFSLSVVEAMASSCPVISTRCGGPEEIIEHDEDGLMVENRNSRELAAAIATIVGDSEKKAMLVERAKLKVEKNFTESQCVKAYESLYRTF